MTILMEGSYRNGLVNATEHMICFCKSEIKKIKESELVPNRFRQITNAGKFNAYNKMLTKLIAKKKTILKRNF